MKPKYLDAIPALRAIAFLLVFLSHSTDTIIPGNMDLSIFLLLSGFCPTYSYMANPQKQLASDMKGSFRFMISHIGKLYPLHIVTMLAVAAGQLLFSGGMSQRQFALGYLPINALLLHAWFPNKAIYTSFNSVSWYLCVMVLCYLLFPAVLSKIKRMSKKQMTIVALCVYAGQIVAAIVVAWILKGDTSEEASTFISWFALKHPLTRACGFLVGCFIGGVFFARGDKGNTEKIQNTQSLKPV